MKVKKIKFIVKLPKIGNKLQKIKIPKIEQSITEKDKQNKTKTKQILNVQIEESKIY